MPIEHVVEQGETTISLADKYGHFPETIWNDPANAELKRKREDMNVLMPGDIVVVPDLRPKAVSKPADQKHRFLRKGVPAKLRLQVFQSGQPRANEAYRLEVDGVGSTGTTNAQGVVEAFVSPQARAGWLRFDRDGAVYELAFGHVDPLDEIVGVQKRLANLGIYGGPLHGELDDLTREALREFQARYGLDVSGEADETTRRRLVAVQDQPSAPLPADPRGNHT